MTTNTTIHGFPIPTSGDANNVPSHLSALFAVIEGGSIIKRLSSSAIAALTSGQKPAGLAVYNTTTDRYQKSDGTNFLDDFGLGVWTNYTPRIVQGTSEPGALTVHFAHWCKIGKLAHVRGHATVATFASPPGAGSIIWMPALPVEVSPASLIGTFVYMYRGASYYQCFALGATDANFIKAANGASLGVAEALGATDQFYWDFSYEIA